MGSTYKKIKYKEEGSWGSTEDHTLYIQHNRSCDVTSFFYEDGTYMFSYSDTIEGNLLDAIIKYATTKDEGLETPTPEEIKKL
jgi:hypothetical protein